jgi:hypothetical protein
LPISQANSSTIFFKEAKLTPLKLTLGRIEPKTLRRNTLPDPKSIPSGQSKWVIILHRGVRGVIWFGFEAKSHPNCKINKYAVWFGSVDF